MLTELIDVPGGAFRMGSTSFYPTHLCAPEYYHRCRSAARSPQPPDTATTHTGFRCVADPVAGYTRRLDCAANRERPSAPPLAAETTNGLPTDDRRVTEFRSPRAPAASSLASAPWCPDQLSVPAA